MPIIAMMQQKGGVGKSTITANLAGELIHAHRTVRLIDLDPQESLRDWARLGAGALHGLVIAAPIENMKELHEAVTEAQRDVEYVLLDSPSGSTEPSMLAALIADVAIVPVTPSPLDLLAARHGVELIRQAQEHRGGVKPIIALLPSRLDRTTLSRNLSDNLKEFNEIVLPGISERVAVTESPLVGLTIREYSGKSDAVGEFQQLAQAIERMVKA